MPTNVRHDSNSLFLQRSGSSCVFTFSHFQISHTLNLFADILFGATQETFVKENRLVSTLLDPTDSGLKPLEVVRQVIGVEGPKVLFVSENIHDFRLVSVLGERFKRRNNAFYRGAVADNIDLRENYAAVEIHEGIVT